MRKICSLLITLLLLCVLLCSCSNNVTVSDVGTDECVSMFVKIEQTGYWCVVYHRETKVMYAVSNYNHVRGIFTVLVDENGDPMIYGGK